MTLLAIALTAGQLGIIAAISGLAAPAVFGTVPGDAAGRYLRRLFPRYFATAAIVAVAAGLTAVLAGHAGAGSLLAADVLCFVVALALVPRINAARDRGDPAFARLHALSVVLNAGGALLGLVALVLLALAV